MSTLPNWTKLNKKGILFCLICGYLVFQNGYGFLCSNTKCERHYDLPAEKGVDVNFFSDRLTVNSTATGTSTNSSTSSSTTTSTTTTLPYQVGGEKND